MPDLHARYMDDTQLEVEHARKFSEAAREEFGFRSKARDIFSTPDRQTDTDEEIPDVAPELIDQPDDVDYAPKSRTVSKRRRPARPKKKKVEPIDMSDEEPVLDADLKAYYDEQVPRVDDNGNDLFCICRRGDLGKWMVGCDGCDEWYHGECINISRVDEGLIDKYFCPRCQRNGHGTTLWKRKCRLTACRKPALNHPLPSSSPDEDIVMADDEQPRSKSSHSKYCSREHGLEYFQNKISQAIISKNHIKSLVIAASNVQDFRQLGDVAPPVQGKVSEADSQRLAQIECQRESIYTGLKKLEAKVNCLNLMRDRSDRVNDALKAQKEKEICGLDERLNLQDEDLETLLESAGFSDSLYGSSSEKLCNVTSKKCSRHAGWYSIKLDGYTLEEEILREDLVKLRREDREIRLAAQRRETD